MAQDMLCVLCFVWSTAIVVPILFLKLMQALDRYPGLLHEWQEQVTSMLESTLARQI